MAKNKKTVKSAVLLSVAAILVVIAIVANYFLNYYSLILHRVFAGDTVDTSNASDSLTYADQVVQDAAEESMVLLKNDDDYLPKAELTKVNLFGWGSTDAGFLLTGGGSGGTSILDGGTTPKVDLTDAFTNAGIEYNTDLIAAYEAYSTFDADWRSGGSTNANPTESLLNPDASFYTDALMKQAHEYSTVAVVTISRWAAENSSTTELVQMSGYSNGTFLELTANEIAMFEKLQSYNFDVIVLLNTTNNLELGFLEEYSNIKACLYVGIPGQSGANAIPKILTGEVNPSGKTSDTLPYDYQTYNPTYSNTYQNNSSIVYQEGIYFGYKWYETADAEGFFDNVTTDYGTGYNGVVQFPFGYGLSYTTFDWELTSNQTSTLVKDGEYTITVKVTNTGSVAGKDVVQLYGSAPYTSGGIEKAERVLLDFAKTEELQPGESCEVSLTFSTYDIASYDDYDANGNGFCGYELDAGNYDFYIMANAHDTANALTFTASVSSTIQYSTDPDTGETVENRFTGSTAYAGCPTDGSTGITGGVEYLSRKNAFANYNTIFDSTPVSTAANSTAQNVRDNKHTYDGNDDVNGEASSYSYGSDAGIRLTQAEDGDGNLSNPSLSLLEGSDTSLTLVYNTSMVEIFKDYVAMDPSGSVDYWNLLLNQMTQAEANKLICLGGFVTQAVASVGKPRATEKDGPAGFNNNVTNGGVSTDYTLYPSEALTGCSWNENIAYEIGKAQGLIGADSGIDGWYAPGVNLHRSVYNSRNYEYYSEDGVLSGKMAAQTVIGAKEQGVYVYVKHFAVSEPGYNAKNYYTWATEQTLRETYLKAFEIAVKDGGANAIMSSFNCVGAVLSVYNHALLTDILRTEWGFEGTVITDWFTGSGYAEDQTAGVLAGNDLWLCGSTEQVTSFDYSNTAVAYAVRRSVKNIIYTYVSTKQYATAITVNAEAHSALLDALWIGLDVLLAAGVVLCVTFAVLPIFKKKKNGPDGGPDGGNVNPDITPETGGGDGAAPDEGESKGKKKKAAKSKKNADANADSVNSGNYNAEQDYGEVTPETDENNKKNKKKAVKSKKKSDVTDGGSYESYGGGNSDGGSADGKTAAKKKLNKSVIVFTAIALILAVVIAVNAVYFAYLPLINGYLFSTQALDSETRQEGEALAEKIETEGIVMVQNNDDVLPLNSSVTKVNVLGWSSTQWIMGGSGSGRSVNSMNDLNPNTDLLDALTDYGVSYNTALTDMYGNYLSYRPNWDGANDGGSLHSFDYEFCRLYEPSVSDSTWYTDEIKTNAISYSDTAIVVIGRVAGESNDCPKVQYKGQYGTSSAQTDETRTYLDISTEEEELLTWAGQNFNNVVVVINSTNTMNLSFLETISGLDACIIVGGTGNNAATAIPKVLYGEASPSGRTVDTYVYDFSTSPAYAYSGSDGVGAYTDDSGCYPIGVQNGNVSNKSTYYDTVSYLDYVEGIYVGYKWYETADAEGFWNSSAANSYWDVTGYNEVVQYPFGYGLTYTQFSYEINSVSPSAGTTLAGDETITVKVKVTNTGSYAAKDVVQLYFSVPYTSGGIEKSALTLAAYAKTTTLEAGEYQILTLEFVVSDMASYDSQEIKVSGGGYILEAGEYTITVRTDSHSVAANTSEIKYNVSSDIRYATDPDTGAAVSNLFDSDGSDGIAVDGSDTEGTIPYLSRADFASTFSHTREADRAMAQKLKDTNLYDGNDVAAWMSEHSDVAMPTTDANYGIKLFNNDGTLTDYGTALGDPANFDSEVWDLVLDQLNVSEMRELVLHGYTKESALSSVGKPQTKSADGPSQIGSFNQTNCGVGYPTATVLAQTWNADLAENYGMAVGNEAKSMGYNGWYAPGVNMHRSAFGGRNYEYYSEDSLLSGVMCAAVVQGAAESGVYTYIKHIIGYDQESARDGIYCWMTEQALREVYLKPFKIAIENGATGLMSSYGRIGAVWSGGSEALLTDLLRTEWGFKGSVLTDYSDHKQYMNGDQMLLAGGDLWMDDYIDGGSFAYLDSSYDTNGAFVTQLRSAAKHVLYSVLNAQYVYANYDETATAGTSNVSAFNWITPIVIAVDVIAVAGCGVWAAFTVKGMRRNKKQAQA